MREPEEAMEELRKEPAKIKITEKTEEVSLTEVGEKIVPGASKPESGSS